MCVCDHTHNSTPSLRPSAYKSKVEGVSSRCGIEQIRKGLHLKRIIPSKREVRPSTKKKEEDPQRRRRRREAYREEKKRICKLDN